jgi:hypothetical protein
MVLSSQVLEHLSDDVLKSALLEMMRVAKHYLLVSVPYREALETRYVRCRECSHVFHPDYHYRSFGERDLATLFPGWVMAEWHVFGPIRWAVGVDPVRSRRRCRPASDLPLASETTVCPKCGKQGEPNLPQTAAKPATFKQRAIASATRRLGRLFPALLAPPYPTFLPQNLAPYWIAALFTKEDGSPLDGDLAEPTSGVLQHNSRPDSNSRLEDSGLVYISAHVNCRP